MESHLFTDIYYLAEALDYCYLMDEDDCTRIDNMESNYGRDTGGAYQNGAQSEGDRETDISPSVS